MMIFSKWDNLIMGQEMCKCTEHFESGLICTSCTDELEPISCKKKKKRRFVKINHSDYR